MWWCSEETFSGANSSAFHGKLFRFSLTHLGHCRLPHAPADHDIFGLICSRSVHFVCAVDDAENDDVHDERTRHTLWIFHEARSSIFSTSVDAHTSADDRERWKWGIQTAVDGALKHHQQSWQLYRSSPNWHSGSKWKLSSDKPLNC